MQEGKGVQEGERDLHYTGCSRSGVLHVQMQGTHVAGCCLVLCLVAQWDAGFDPVLK